MSLIDIRYFKNWFIVWFPNKTKVLFRNIPQNQHFPKYIHFTGTAKEE